MFQRLEECEPRWFRVVFEPRVPVRMKASVQARRVGYSYFATVVVHHQHSETIFGKAFRMFGPAFSNSDLPGIFES